MTKASFFSALSLTTIAALYACGSDSSGSPANDVPDASFTPPPTNPTPTPTPTPTPPPPPADGGGDSGGGRTYTGPSGVLDTTFAGTGFATKSGAAGGANDLARGIALDSLDRIVAVGSSEDAMGFNTIASWRLTVAGAFDASFGTGGVWFSKNILSSGKYADGQAIAIDAQDRPILSGQGDNGFPIYMALWRLTTAGAPDATFNTTGVVGHSNTGGAGYDLGQAIKRDKDGNYVLAGFTNATGFAMNSATWRFTTAGALDTTFGNPNGYVMASGTLGSSPSTQSLNAIAFDTNDDVIVAGGAKDAQNTFKAILFRYTKAGAPVAGFGASGYVALSGIAGGMAPAASDGITGLAVDAQHRIIVCGTSNTLGGVQRGFVGRLSSTGAPDATFGTNGFVVFDPASGNQRSNVRSCALDAQGRVVAVGGSTLGNAQPNRAMAWRVTTAGALDTTFGTQGVFSKTGTAGGTDDFAWGVAIDSAGCAVIAGQSKDGSGNLTAAFWRLTP